jgi:hypothetical protein
MAKQTAATKAAAVQEVFMVNPFSLEVSLEAVSRY